MSSDKINKWRVLLSGVFYYVWQRQRDGRILAKVAVSDVGERANWLTVGEAGSVTWHENEPDKFYDGNWTMYHGGNGQVVTTNVDGDGDTD